MSRLQEKARDNSSSDNENASRDDDKIFEDRENGGYKSLILKQIIGGIPG